MASQLPQESQEAAPVQAQDPQPQKRPAAQKSHGAWPRGQEPHPSSTAETQFIDHANNTGISIYWGQSPRRGAPVLPPQWSFQVYVTYGPTASSAPGLPSEFNKGAESAMCELVPWRFDFNFLPGADMEACKAHYRREKAARAQAKNIPLYFVPRWYDKGGYCGSLWESMLILMDSPNWADKGVSVVSWDLPPQWQDPASDWYDPTVKESRIERGIKVFKTEPGPPADGTRYVGERMWDARYQTKINSECENRYVKAIEEEGRSSWSEIINVDGSGNLEEGMCRCKL